MLRRALASIIENLYNNIPDRCEMRQISSHFISISDFSRAIRMLTFHRLCGLAFIVSCVLRMPIIAGELRTLQSFGVTAHHCYSVRPYAANLALGLYDPDPLFDLAYCADGKVQVWRNLGNGTFGSKPVYEQRVHEDVVKLEFKLDGSWR